MKNIEDLTLAEGLELGLQQAIDYKRGDTSKATATTVEINDSNEEK